MFNHLTYVLICLHWLRIPELIRFKMAVLAYRSIHGTAPLYLANFRSVFSVSGRRERRSAITSRLGTSWTRCATMDTRAFPVAGAEVFNSLPSDMTSAPILSIFRNRLEKFLFDFSFRGLVV
jgi:hypothetical protein